jgi:hypothetical protein
MEAAWGYFLTRHNAAMTGEAASISSVANMSVSMNFPMGQAFPDGKLSQKSQVDKAKARAAATQLDNKNYILFYNGDWDGVSWLNNIMPRFWEDPRRGDIPIMWPIVPVNKGRAKPVYDMMYSTATDNDIFTGGNNGYAYMHPTMYQEDRGGLNGTLDSFLRETGDAYKEFDIDIMGYYFSPINDQTPYPADLWGGFMNKWSSIAPGGFIPLFGRTDGLWDFNGMTVLLRDPFDGITPVAYRGGNGSLLTDGQMVHQRSVHSMALNVTEYKRPRFHVSGTALASPTSLANGLEYLQAKYPEYRYEAVDPYTFFKLYRDYMLACAKGTYSTAFEVKPLGSAG